MVQKVGVEPICHNFIRIRIPEYHQSNAPEVSSLKKWTCEYAVHLLHATTGYMGARMRRVLAMNAEFVFFPCREKRRGLFEITAKKEDRVWGVSR